MLYYDLGTDGKSGDRVWKEVYGILTGNQLAFWDAVNLARCRDSPEKLLETSCRPQYLNFTDAIFNAMAVLPTAKLQLENVIVVLTTLKNRYIIQLRSKSNLEEMLVALRLSAYEHQALQEAYTGALLSARGLQLSDIRTILSATRYDHAEWVKIRYGSGTAWKRCYMVIQPLSNKKKGLSEGRISIYENDTCKKREILGEITGITSVCAVYPQLHFFIDRSTMLKLEGTIFFRQHGGKKRNHSYDTLSDHNEASLFILPEEHNSVPGYDTLIRFLIPIFDAFGKYGRPKRLKADRMDPDSLLFGLPTLPSVYYLEVDDLLSSMQSLQYLGWTSAQWRLQIKLFLTRKLSQGYNGCGTAKPKGLQGQISATGSPVAISPLLGRFPVALSPSPTNSDLKGVMAERLVSAGQAQDARKPAGGDLKPGFMGSTDPVRPLKQTVAPVATVGGPSRSGSPANSYNQRRQYEQQKQDSKPVTDLTEIYHNYTKLQTPSDNFGDRNKILNGSEEEFDETKLPALMRKKSLMQGPYPSHDKFLGESDESGLELDSGSEEEELNSGRNKACSRPLHLVGSSVAGAKVSQATSVDTVGKPSGKQFLAPNHYEERNSSYSSVQSPNTQYQEFNKQFSKNFANTLQEAWHTNNSDLESQGSDEAPAPPTHGLCGKGYPSQGSQPHPTDSSKSPCLPNSRSLRQRQQQYPPPLTPALSDKITYLNLPQRENKPPMTHVEDSFARNTSPRRTRALNQPQNGYPNSAGNRVPSHGQGQSNAMQQMQSKFQQASVENRGYEQQQQGQNYGHSPSQGAGPMPIHGQGQQQIYNMQYQNHRQQQTQQVSQQRGTYSGPPQSGSPQQRGQYMQRHPHQMYGGPQRPHGYGAPRPSSHTGQPAGPQASQYRGPNHGPMGKYGNPHPGYGGNPNWSQMQGRPPQAQQYAHNPTANMKSFGPQPRPALYSQETSLSMRSTDDQQQYRYQVSPNFAPSRAQGCLNPPTGPPHGGMDRAPVNRYH